MICPPGVPAGRWRALVAMCGQMDDRYNRAENVGKPRLTCGNDTRSNDGSTMMEGDPGAASTAPGLADTSVEGADNG